ncbi:hypothetical protein GOP47_0001429 [Adiantum capillus-veneris]|uniref:Cytochrome P450 n=1 Tax=Adiantum capillus-veneris TaxID=13818 RepID=A0A9D4ZQ25_ADICA|nr:hypothetical protein GOP47_0001429 [Adiantum capillus-veneris]
MNSHLMMASIADFIGIAVLLVGLFALMSSHYMRAPLKSIAEYIRKAKRMQNSIPPGSFGLPLIGESMQFISSYRSSVCPDTFIAERRLRFGRIFTTHLFGKPTVISLDAEVNRFILNSDGRLFMPDYPTSLKQLWGKWAILMLEGSFHKRIHGVVATLFKSDDLKDHLLRHIEDFIQQAMESWNTNSTIYLEEEAKKISFQVTAKVLVGLDPGATTVALRTEFHKFIAGVVSVPINLPGTTFYSSLQSRARMVQMIKGIIEEREGNARHTDREQKHVVKVHLDVLGVLLEERRLMNSKEREEGGEREEVTTTEAMPLDAITDNIVSFFFPAEDSVAMLMSLAVKYVSECPRALLQLREENLNFVDKYKGEKMNSRHYLMQLPFTHCVLNETLRLGNIVKGVIRKALVDVHVKGFLIPKGWAVFPFFRGVHLDEAIYEDADQFNPWRWQEKVALSHYTPFGGGPRYCAGLDIARLEAAVFLHHLVTRYEWELGERDTLTHFPFVKLAKRLPINIIHKQNCKNQSFPTLYNPTLQAIHVMYARV